MSPVSICLTTWNRASILPQTIDSLLKQSFQDFELIISDDCSSDKTSEVCRAYELKDSRVKYYRNERNLGMPGNLNAAIRRATGTYIANVHDGDIFRADLIAKWKMALDTIPTATFVFNAYDATQPNGSHHIYQLPFELLVPGEEIALHYFRTVTSCVWGTVMARASAYVKAGLFDPSFGFISDVDMWLRMIYEAPAVYINEPLITLGQRPKDHPFRHGIWCSAFWAFNIYRKHLEAYRSKLPLTVKYYQSRYPQTLRHYFLRTMFSSLKNMRWERVREGLGIWQDASDPLLKKIGCLFGHHFWQPEWYEKNWWEMTYLTK